MYNDTEHTRSLVCDSYLGWIWFTCQSWCWYPD